MGEERGDFFLIGGEWITPIRLIASMLRYPDAYMPVVQPFVIIMRICLRERNILATFAAELVNHGLQCLIGDSPWRVREDMRGEESVRNVS